MYPSNILVHVSGSISAYKACALCSLLVKDGCSVQVTASEAGLRFAGKSSFEGLTGKPVITDMFGGYPDTKPHITLAQKWASLIIAYPASADCINRLACGLADDIFGAVCLANNFKKPLLIAPAMNSEMFAHPAVTESLERLCRWGAQIVQCGEGRLACGESGLGRLAEPDDVRDLIRSVLCVS